jgi:NADH:flavin oxidoreductase / NADH oxidase family
MMVHRQLLQAQLLLLGTHTARYVYSIQTAATHVSLHVGCFAVYLVYKQCCVDRPDQTVLYTAKLAKRWICRHTLSSSSYRFSDYSYVHTIVYTIVVLYTQDDKRVQHDLPRALKLSEIPDIVHSYTAAAERAKHAGFDFIQIHCANGYLPDSFLQSCSNKRTDAYDGNFENRFRFLREIIEAIIKVVPASHVIVRLSPNGSFNDMVSVLKRTYIT